MNKIFSITALCSSKLLLALTLPAVAMAQAPPATKDYHVQISADFRQQNLVDAAESITIVDSQQLSNSSAEHLEQILHRAPNVNFSSGSSRARFFQIRGIGERSEFTYPVSSSVGLSIDGIDLTGLGGAASLYDLQQVEVLRGPQGTRFGANALAGYIKMLSKAPTTKLSGNVYFKAGNYNTFASGVALSDAFTPSLRARLAVFQSKSDGYIENIYLERKDTNNFDESSGRLRLDWDINANSSLELSFLKVKALNGYDAFSLDNNRKTRSNEPGVDQQDTAAIAAKLTTLLPGNVEYQALIAHSDSDINYGYDEDWTYKDFYTGYWEGTDQYLRSDKRSSVDLRLLSAQDAPLFGNTDWVLGVYAMQRDRKLDRNYSDPSKNFDNELNIKSFAGYTDLTTALSDNSRLVYGARVEKWQHEYKDSNNIQGDDSELLGGGKFGFEYDLSAQHLAYITYARGYKAGGTNNDVDVTQDKRHYKTEKNNTYELGLHSNAFDNKLNTRIAAFYVQRLDQQVKSSFAKPTGGGGTTFQDYVANAAEGKSYGLEFEGSWQLTQAAKFNWAVAHLETEFVDYVYKSGSVPNEKTVDKTGREQAHAPSYTLFAELEYELIPNLSMQLSSLAKNKFYFSDSHDEQSDAFAGVTNVRLAYRKNGLMVALYGKNITDKEYATRGFGGFGNDPRNGYKNGKYVQLGEPLTYGLEASYSF